MIAGKSGEIMAHLREGAHVALRDDACNACFLLLTPGLFASSSTARMREVIVQGWLPGALAFDERCNMVTE